MVRILGEIGQLDFCIFPSNCNYAAVAGRDFTSQTLASLVGFTMARVTKCFDISIIDDSEQEQSERFSVNVDLVITTSSGSSGLSHSIQITIVDNDG